MRHEYLNQGRTPPQITIPPPPHRPRIPSVDRQARSGFRIASIRKNANTDVPDGIAIIETPSDRIGADIETEACRHPKGSLKFFSSQNNCINPNAGLAKEIQKSQVRL